MKEIVKEKIKKAKESAKNTLLREVVSENKLELVLVALTFLALAFPVLYSSLSRSVFLPAIFASSDPDRVAEEKKEKNLPVKDIRDIEIDTSGWKNYSNNWYGFQIKYPENWSAPAFQRADSSSSFEYRYLFRKAEESEKDKFSGFDVVVYNLNKIGSPIETDEIVLKNISQVAKDEEKCQDIDGHLGEYEEFSAEEISIPKREECFEQAYFFSLTRDSYIYNIVPILNGDPVEERNFERKIKKEFPEFIASTKSFELTKIIRPKPKPVITAPKPLAKTKKINGKRYCDKKNDKPKKSKVHKEKHMDMECCLDPDEYPNPWCAY